MKKTLVALATLSAIGSAFADVDVSGGIKLYGVIDQAVTQQTLRNPSSATGITSTYTGMFASQATSRLGFKGTRDLGDGMKGRIQAEIQVEPDNSTQLPAKNRGTFVGLSKEGSGEVLLGTQETTAYEIFGMDVNGRVEYKPQVWRTTASNDLQDRANNSLKYVSPEMAGFTIHLHKAFSDTASGPNTFVSYGVKFHQDNLKAAFVKDKLENAQASYKFAGVMNAGPSKEGATMVTGQSTFAMVYAGAVTSEINRQIGSVSYDFGSFSANYIYARSYVTDSNVGSLTTNTVGIKVPFDKITVATSIGTGTIDSYSTNSGNSASIAKDGTLTDWTTGFYYNIDKATNVYFLYSSSTVSGQLQNGSNKTFALGARYNF